MIIINTNTKQKIKQTQPVCIKYYNNNTIHVKLYDSPPLYVITSMQYTDNNINVYVYMYIIMLFK